MRLEIDDDTDDLPLSLAVTLPDSDRSIQVAVVWSVRQPERAWQCGAEISDASDLATTAWRDRVDSV